VKLGLEDASVWVFLAIRSAGAALALLIASWLFAWPKWGPGVLKVPLRSVYQAFAIGLVLQVGYQTTYFFSLDKGLAPGVLAIILGLQPILTSVFAQDRVDIKGYAILLVGLAGLIIAVVGAREVGSVTPLGVVYGILSVLAISIGSILQKRANVQPLASAFYQTIAAAVVFIALLPLVPVRLEITAQFVLSATWMILVVSTLAVLLLFYMLTRGAASKVSVLFYMVPVVTIALDYLVFGTAISLTTLAGASLVVVSVVYFNRMMGQGKQPEAPGASALVPKPGSQRPR